LLFYPVCVSKGHPKNILDFVPFICYETLIQLNFIAYFLCFQKIFPFKIITNVILVTFYSQMVIYKLIFYPNYKSIFFFFQKYYYLESNFINLQVFLCSLLFIFKNLNNAEIKQSQYLCKYHIKFSSPDLHTNLTWRQHK
jgi:hypothetical protein